MTTSKFTPKLWAGIVLILAFMCAACQDSAPATVAEGSTTDAEENGARTYELGEFPAFPKGTLPANTTARLQTVLDYEVEAGIFTGVTATVILADRGSWTGIAGSLGGEPLTAATRLPTHSSGKTIVAAQIMRLAEEGKLDLDDRASEYLPPDLGFFDANGATIRQVLGMQSGIPDLNEYKGNGAGFYPAEQASTSTEVFRMLREPKVRPGTRVHYASTNYVLLGTIIEQASGLPLAEALRSGVLHHRGLDGYKYTVNDALAGDGWGVETTSPSLARWGYSLYGGFVLSDASLQEMTDFRGKWYGLGTMNFRDDYGTLAVGHDGTSSTTTCCAVIRLVAIPKEGAVIAVQANTAKATGDWAQVVRAAQELRNAYLG